MGEHRARHEEDEQRVEEDVAVEGGEAPVTDEEHGGHGGGGEAPRERPDCQEAEGDDADPEQGAEHAHPVHLGDMRLKLCMILVIFKKHQLPINWDTNGCLHSNGLLVDLYNFWAWLTY